MPPFFHDNISDLCHQSQLSNWYLRNPLIRQIDNEYEEEMPPLIDADDFNPSNYQGTNFEQYRSTIAEDDEAIIDVRNTETFGSTQEDSAQANDNHTSNAEDHEAIIDGRNAETFGCLDADHEDTDTRNYTREPLDGTFREDSADDITRSTFHDLDSSFCSSQDSSFCSECDRELAQYQEEEEDEPLITIYLENLNIVEQ